MKPLSRPMFTAVASLFALVMIATRFNHFGDALHLPDASMALFFLGGLYLRKHLAFLGFVVVMLGVSPDTRIALYIGAAWVALLAIAYRLFQVEGRMQLATQS